MSTVPPVCGRSGHERDGPAAARQRARALWWLVAASNSEGPGSQLLGPSLPRHAMSSSHSRRSEFADGEVAARPGTIEQQIEVAVRRALDLVLGPHMRRLSGPEPAVYTIAQAAFVMQVSSDTILRLVKRGTLPRVPHLDRKVLIPRAAVEQLVGAQSVDRAPTAGYKTSPLSKSSIRSAAALSDPGTKWR
jgi:excisionase family DNA binding protein